MKRQIKVSVANCTNQNLMELMENAYKKIGGDNKVSPYLTRMSNHDPGKEFYSGAMVSKKHSVLLDYAPINELLSLTIISPSEFKYEEIVHLVKDRFPECTIK